MGVEDGGLGSCVALLGLNEEAFCGDLCRSLVELYLGPCAASAVHVQARSRAQQ